MLVYMLVRYEALLYIAQLFKASFCAMSTHEGISISSKLPT